MNLPGVIQIQTVMLQEPFTLNIPILIGNPGNAHVACRTHGKFIDRYLMAGMKIQRILSHQLFVGFGRNEIIISFQRNKTRINAAQKVHHDTSVKRINLRHIPVYASPLEPGINSNWFCSNTVLISVKEISVPGDFPLWGRPLRGLIYDFIILRRESERIVIKLILELVYVGIRIFHRSQLILLPDLIQALLARTIRLVAGEEVLEYFPIHKPALLNGSGIIASQK